jgi:hypothetical protein
VSFRLLFTPQALADYRALERDKGLAKRLSAVRKTLGFLQTNPRHPSLQCHEFTSLSRTAGHKVFEAYAENQSSAAYRVFWYYGPGKGEITILAITPHP